MAWPPEDLPAFTREYAKLIAKDRRTYAKLKEQFYNSQTLFIWKTIDEAIQARVAYYRGEVVRARRDTASYMLGGDPERKGLAYDEKLCLDLDWAITMISDDMSQEDWGNIDTHVWEVESIGEALKRRTYAS